MALSGQGVSKGALWLKPLMRQGAQVLAQFWYAAACQLRDWK
jgi:hypothetical protein